MNILAFGAASGICHALLKRYAARGAQVYLVGRNPDSLEAVAQDLATRGASVAGSAAYDFNDTAASRALINSIQDIQTQSITAPVSLNGKTAICRGTEITVIIDDSLLTGSSVFLFSSVLHEFFALYCSINSFTRLIVKLKGKTEVFKIWPPRVGEKAVI